MFKHRYSWKEPKPAKTACVVRYGGFGDQLQAANILPELKRQGYHVTFMTTPKGQDILKHDPHIDAFFIQDPDQVPNHELGKFWGAQSRRFDKFINLSESVEGTLLAQPGRMIHIWPDSVRRKVLNRNYLEFVADIAEVPYRSEAKFYPAPEEAAWARKFIAGLNKNVFERAFPILWALSGSSIHKATPHADAIIARIMLEMPEAHVILTGDEACQILECGWETEPRVHLRSNKLTIRESITLAQECALVVGPETGVLNAVAFEEVPKVIFMSHSSTENLTKHWKNAVSLIPPRTECYPCHRLHFTSEFCHLEEETHAAMCQFNIKPEQAFEPIFAAYRAWKKRQLVAA
jgi:ADP-heptose:LPS heptosyltransferase